MPLSSSSSSGEDISIIHSKPADRISQLPDDLLHYILSFLQLPDVLEAAFLSKRWAHLCSRLPFIDIDIPEICMQRNLSMSRKNLDQFVNFITWVLSSRTAVSITRLRLVWCCRYVDYSLSPQQVYQWMLAAAKRNVQEFILFFQPSDIFHLPLSFVSCPSLQILDLDLFHQALQLPSYPGVTHLKTLSLTNIKLTDQDSTRTFFSGCPFLNKLVLSISAFDENMNILDISSCSIEHLFFEFHGTEWYTGIDFKISCPRLIAFKYGAPMPRKFIFEDVSSLETMHMNPYLPDNGSLDVYGFLKTAHKIVDLKLGMYIVRDLVHLERLGDKFRCDLCSFHRLKALHLWITITDVYLGFLSLLLMHCDNLEVLTLYCDEESDDNTLSEIKDLSKCTCLRSSINTIHLINMDSRQDMIAFAKTLLECGLVLKRFVLYWHPMEEMDNEDVERIFSFPTSSEYDVEYVIVPPTGSYQDYYDLSSCR